MQMIQLKIVKVLSKKKIIPIHRSKKNFCWNGFLIIQLSTEVPQNIGIILNLCCDMHKCSHLLCNVYSSTSIVLKNKVMYVYKLDPWCWINIFVKHFIMFNHVRFYWGFTILHHAYRFSVPDLFHVDLHVLPCQEVESHKWFAL